MGITVDIENCVETKRGTFSVWDKESNDGSGGYRFGKIYFISSDKGLTIEIVGSVELKKLVKIKHREEDAIP